MASMSPPIFPSSARSSDATPHKLTYATPNFSTTSRLNRRSNYSSTRFAQSLSRVSDSSTFCRCQKNNDMGNSNSSSRDDESPGRWDSGFQENVRNMIKWFDDYMDGYRKTHLENIKMKKDDSGGDGVKKEAEVVMDSDGDEDWDWERWKKHFTEVDEQERIVSILQSQLNRAVVKEDYEDAARIKVSIAAAATNDTVGRVMCRLNKAIKEEHYKDATFVRDYASAGLVGWWAGFSDDSKDPYGRIICISAEHGRYLARSYSPRQLAKAADGSPLFEVFITMNEKGEYKHQAVYLKRSEVPTDFPIASSKLSDLISSVNPLDSIGDKGDLFAKDSEDTEDVEDEDDSSDMAEEYGFENIMRDMIPGAKDLKIKVMNLIPPGKIDRDLISKVVEQIMEEDEDDEDDEEENDKELENMNEVTDGTDVVQIDIDFDGADTIIDGEGNGQIAVKVVVGDLVQKVSNDTSHKDLIRVPAKLEKKSHSSFTFSIEKEKQQVSSGSAQSPRHGDARLGGNRRIDSVMLDLAKSIGRGKIPMKVLKDVNQLINLTLNQAQSRQPLSGSTTFNRIELPSSGDPLNGLYVGAHGIYTSEVIQLKRKFGQWQEDGSMKEFSNLEFYEYVEAVKITGDPYVPAGQIAFRAKIGTKYQLPHRGIIPEEFGVIARYRGQGRLADPGFQNPRWVDGELVILDGKYINGGPVVGFVYWDSEYHFLVFFNQLRLQG
ncbi:protein EXECUTER 1, chloroplastic-like [Cynara cardunculus var. scolymus]|uniref:protein EXECUTER 1, chloroplastic-like n=1 Tax=Cynara cardunculus var. scolymus TaxID=59895 RepID=UPI000D62897A|nr:protein EXECUTER 1, chloroplastic-like [Cynara cardunculus var. scolymus]